MSKKMLSDEEYTRLRVSNINEVLNIFSKALRREVVDDKDFDNDNYRLFRENVKRAEHVTEILSQYETQQKERYAYKRDKKKVIFNILMVMLVVLTITLLISVILYFALKMNSNQALAGLISGCVTYISSLFAIFMIIVKYIFPEDEEKNFNDLIATIIQDDTNRIKNQYDFFSKINDTDRNCK